MDEESAEVAVAALGYSAEPALEAARVLSRGEAQPTRQVPSGREAMDVSDEGEQRGGSQQSDAGDGEEVGDDGQLLSHRLELAFDRRG
jgi:hypothetical protein